MPVIAPSNSNIYDTVEACLNTARARLNDAIVSIGGEVLTDNQPFTQVLFNAAWRRMCEFLGNLGYTRFTNEVVLKGLPIVSNLDPASQCFISWNGYFDGNSYWPTPALPQDMISPLKIWERPSGQNWPFPVHPNTENMVDGLPADVKQQYNYCWEWRQDTIYIPGALQVVDLRIRYLSYLVDFVSTPDTEWYNLQIPVARCLSPLSKYLCYEVTLGRGDLDASVFMTEGEAEAKLIMNRDTRAKQRTNIRRIPRGSSRGGGGGGGGYGPYGFGN